ncbi:hypothetical protein PFISCL1PPCAC_3093, partial [Pristionchus fissidentatus]
SSLSPTIFTPCNKHRFDILKQQISLPLGGLVILFNAVLLLSVLLNKRLRIREEYRLMVALSFADFSEGLASFIGAAYRSPFYMSDDGCYQFATPLYCMVLPHNIIWRFADTATAFMLAAIALDRYIAISYPFFHSRNSSETNAVMISTVYGVSILCMIYSWIMPIQLQVAGKILQKVCSTGGLIDPVYTIVVKCASGAGSALSAIIHAVVTYKRTKRIRGHCEKTEQLISRREIKFTITTMIKGASTILFDSIPRLYGVYDMIQEQLTGETQQNDDFGSFIVAIVNLNCLLNVFIYAGGQPEVR